MTATVETGPATLRPRDRSRRTRVPAASHLALGLTLVLSAVLAVYSLSISAVTLDGDEAVTGIMAHRILTGQQQYVYFTSQGYNGSIEQYLQALLYAVTRLPENPFTLRLVQVALSVVTTFVIYLVARLVLVRPWAAVLASALFAAGPFWRVWLSTRSYGAYDTTQLVCLLAVYFTLRATGFGPGRTRRQPGRWAVGLWLGLYGLCFGLVAWLGWSGFEVLVATSIWLLPTLVRSWRGALLGVLGIVIGAAPALVWAVHHRMLPTVGEVNPPTTLHDRVRILVDYVGRQYLGVTPFMPHWLVIGAFVLSALLGLAAVVVRWRGLLGIPTLRLAPRNAGDLLLFIIPVTLVIYVTSSFSWYRGSPRYLFMLFPITAIAFAMVFQTVWSAASPKLLRRRTLSQGVRGGVALAGLLAIVFGTWQTVWATHHSLSTSTFTTDAQLTDAADYMAAHGMTHAYSEYWGALPLQYFAEDEITVAPWGVGAGKSGASRPAVDASPTFVYVTTHRNELPVDQELQAALKAHGVTYKATRLPGDITIYSQLSTPLRPAQLGLAN